MDSINKLKDLLQRLNNGEKPEKVKKEAQEFLASIEAKDLALAEQKLIEAGIAPEDLRHLCSAHMEMLGDEVKMTKADLKPGHVIHTMMSEHKKILGFLDELERVNQSIQKMESCGSGKEEFTKLLHIAEHLLGAEPHHQREEEVLFPELEKKGVYGPPQVMRMEHIDLRNGKKELKELAESVENMDFNTFKERLNTVAKSIIPTLRDHIFKEDNILYLTALQVISDNEVWDKMKVECDKIGYCYFTPQAEKIREN